MWIIDKIIEGVSRAIDQNPLNALWALAIGLAALAIVAALIVLTVRGVRSLFRQALALASARRAAEEEGKDAAQKAKRVKVKIDPVTLMVALIAFAVSGQGMWKFFGEKMGLADSPLRLGFIVLEALALACALRIRKKTEIGEAAGVDWWIMWGIAVLSGLMSATDASNGPEAVLRLLMPVIAGVAWELALSGARNLIRERLERAHERSRAVMAFAPKRLLAKLGWMDASGRSLDEVVRERVITKAALMSDRYLTLKTALVSVDENGKPLTEMSAKAAKELMSARTAARKRWRIATEQAGLGSDPVATRMFLKKLAMLREFDKLDTLKFEDVWKIVNQPDVQVSEERRPLAPPPPPQPKRRQHGKITPARQNGVPVKALNYWVEVVASTGDNPTTEQLEQNAGAGSPQTARRWHKALRTQDLSALISAAQAGSPKALTNVNGHAHLSKP